MQITLSNQLTLALFHIFVSISQRHGLSIYFLRKNIEECAGASGTQMFSQALNVILLQKGRRETFPEIEKLE